MNGTRMNAQNHDAVSHEVLALEHAALTRWCAGDPSGFLEICAPDVVYFDPFLEHRLDGLPALTAYYENIRGKIRADRFEVIDAFVHTTPHIAVLTFNFASWGGSEDALRWNCTEVFRQDAVGYRIVHSHWSFTQPKSS